MLEVALPATASNTLHIASSTLSLITCAVVLLYLYQPAYLGSSRLLGTQLRVATSTQDRNCLLAASNGWWQRTPPGVSVPDPPLNVAVRNPQDAFTAWNETLAYQWVWHLHPGCDIRRRSHAEIVAALRNHRLAFIGDSHVRYFHNWVSRALGGEEYSKVDSNKPQSQHNKGQYLPRINVTLTVNMTHLASEVQAYLEVWNGPWPDLLVMDSSVWHLFTKKNISDYTQQMINLLSSITMRVPASTTLVWLSPPPRHTVLRPDYADLPAEWIRLYNRVAQDLGFLYPRGPAFHLDFYSLALDCLPWCTRDGLHFKDSGLELGLQILVNWLLQLGSW